jgi:hypothetical protein
MGLEKPFIANDRAFNLLGWKADATRKQRREYTPHRNYPGFYCRDFFGLSSQIGVSSQLVVASGAFLALIIALIGRT